MRLDKQPTQMILDQLDLLSSEEKKLKKFVIYNEGAEPVIEEHLSEIRKKKERLHNLCQMMGISYKDAKTEAEAEVHEQISNHISAPTGRFGSALINLHPDSGN